MALGRLPIEAYVQGILSEDRVILGRAITLVESQLPSDQILREEVISQVLPHSGKSIRIGVTGVPGVGKSSFIEKLGLLLVEQGHRVAVLAIDPSSQLTKGSILGDKTRMEQLAHHPRAFVRPSPTGGTLGGVAQRTRETMLLCEAAGFDVILIETVGVGQSETTVRDMVDFFLLLMLPHAGDELQGIKKGIMEMADGLVIHKADPSLAHLVQQAYQDYQNALHLFPRRENDWTTPVIPCSSLENTGHDVVWRAILAYEQQTKTSGWWKKNRQTQKKIWVHHILHEFLIQQFLQQPGMSDRLAQAEADVLADRLTAPQAIRQLFPPTPTNP